MLLFRARKHIQHKIELEILHKAEGGLLKTKPAPQLLDKRVLELGESVYQQRPY